MVEWFCSYSTSPLCYSNNTTLYTRRHLTFFFHLRCYSFFRGALGFFFLLKWFSWLRDAESYQTRLQYYSNKINSQENCSGIQTSNEHTDFQALNQFNCINFEFLKLPLHYFSVTFITFA